MKISLCIPMFNEVKIIEDTAIALHQYMSETFSDYEILFVDDGSTDGSAALVEALALPSVRVLGYEKNRGKGFAVRTAMLAATGDVVMFTDADLAYGLDVVERVAQAFEDDPQTDIVLGSRNLMADGYEGYTFLRKLASKAYIFVLCFLGGLKLTDSQCGCKAFRQEAAKKIFSRAEVDGFAFDFEAIMIAEKYGLRITELPVRVVNHRDSSVNLFSDALKMLYELCKIKKRIRKMKLQ